MRRSPATVRVTLTLLLTWSIDAVCANDPIRLYDAAKKFHDEWAQKAAETQRQLDAAQAKADKAREAANLDRPVAEMEKRAEAIIKDGPKGIKEAFKSIASGKPPFEAAKIAWKMRTNFIKSQQAEMEFVDIAYDEGQVQERAAETQKEVSALEAALRGEQALVDAAQKEMDRLASSVSLKGQFVAAVQRALVAAAAAEKRQQDRRDQEAKATAAAAAAKARSGGGGSRGGPEGHDPHGSQQPGQSHQATPHETPPHEQGHQGHEGQQGHQGHEGHQGGNQTQGPSIGPRP